MNRILFILLLPLLLFSASLHAQLQKVIVEKYYISDQFDATDTIGGTLDSGSVTYRIYVDMQPRSKLKRVYGEANHVLKITSTAPFFNNKSRGRIIGKDISVAGLDENTAALDTWITMGQVTGTAGGKTYFGVLKTQDVDGSIIGGANNDGGSAGISGGLLVNTNADEGIPLTTEDGMDTLLTHPVSWGGLASINFSGSYDSSIFGNKVVASQFECSNTLIQNEGTMGVDSILNQVIIAQLTTKGELSFELNIEIVDSTGFYTDYVANDSAPLLPKDPGHKFRGEKLSRYLKYPFHLLCTCPDPDYMEYNADRECDNMDSCLTRIVFGCMDVNACNYNPNANVSVSDLCCYPGYCNNRDIATVCQTIAGINNPGVDFEFNLFPNPAHDQLNIQVITNSNKEVNYELYDFSGRVLLKKNIGIVSGTVNDHLDISTYDNGLYVIRLYVGDISITKKFIKD